MEEEKCNSFWTCSNQRENWLKLNDPKPAEFHKWGILNNISERSPVLAGLLKVRNTEGIQHKMVFDNVLEELGLTAIYRELPTKKKWKDENIRLMCCEVDSTPGWSFIGQGSTTEEGLAKACKSGLEFFMSLAQEHSIFG